TDREVRAEHPLEARAGADAVEIDAGAGERGARIGVAGLRVEQPTLADHAADADAGIEIAIGGNAAVGNGGIGRFQLDADHGAAGAEIIAAGDAEGDAALAVAAAME